MRVPSSRGGGGACPYVHRGTATSDWRGIRWIRFFEEVTQQLVRVAAIQWLMDEHGFEREMVAKMGVDTLEGSSEEG